MNQLCGVLSILFSFLFIAIGTCSSNQMSSNAIIYIIAAVSFVMGIYFLFVKKSGE